MPYLRAAERITSPCPINLGTGREITIRALARQIADLCDFPGDIAWDTSQPDGQPRRRLDVSRAQTLLDWKAETSLSEGLRHTIAWWRAQPSRRDVSACA